MCRNGVACFVSVVAAGAVCMPPGFRRTRFACSVTICTCQRRDRPAGNVLGGRQWCALGSCCGRGGAYVFYVSAGAVLLEKCAAAIARGKGQELWQLQASGKLVSVASGLCAAAVGADVTLSGCDAVPQNGSQWEATGSGQFKLSSEDLCLTQRGPSLGVADLAPAAAASASSTSNIAPGALLFCHGLSPPVVLCMRMCLCRCQ